VSGSASRGQPPGEGLSDAELDSAARRDMSTGADPAPRRSRRMLDDVFGDVLPDTTSDETGADPGTGDAIRAGHSSVDLAESSRDDLRRDDELRRDVPPHHG